MPDATTLPEPLSGLAGFLGLPTLLEWRAPIESVQLMNSDVWGLPEIPGAGDWTVVLVPGFMASEYSLAPLARWLERLGFSTRPARVGINAGPGASGTERVIEALRGAGGRDGGKRLLIGHSRGGQLASVAAVREPDLVDAVVTLGSPIRVANPRHFLTRIPVAGIKAIGGRLLGPEAVEAEDRYEDDLEGAFPDSVARWSIWSRTDGIVDWRASMLGEGRDIEVAGSHVGLATNPRVYAVLYDTLSRIVSGDA